MQDMTMGPVESRFADMIWANEPISSSVLWKLAEEEFGWKKSTTFTVLKRLCDKGIFLNQEGTVSSLVTKGDFVFTQSERFIRDTFDGSLPAFLAAFTKNKPLSSEEVSELRRIVAEYEEGKQ